MHKQYYQMARLAMANEIEERGDKEASDFCKKSKEFKDMATSSMIESKGLTSQAALHRAVKQEIKKQPK
jgi:hypothetical protein